MSELLDNCPTANDYGERILGAPKHIFACCGALEVNEASKTDNYED